MDSSQLIGFSCTLCLIPNSSSIVTPSVSAIIGRSIISGIVALFSHFEIACDDTPIIPERFSCVRPLSLRSSAIFSPNVFIFYRFPSLLLLFSVNRDPYYISCFKKFTDIIGRVMPTVLIENQPKKRSLATVSISRTLCREDGSLFAVFYRFYIPQSLSAACST